MGEHKSDQSFEDEVMAFAYTVWSYRMGEAVSMMIHLGDRLGLYQAMQGAGPVTAEELAETTGLDRRLLDEWLHGQAAAGLLDHRDGRFELDAVKAAVMADEDGSTAFAAGAFGGGVAPSVMDAVEQSFRTGRGITYEQQGPAAAAGLARLTAPSNRASLVPTIIPALSGVENRLKQGGTVVDVGCGGGVALLSVAAAFPQARCIGLDPSSTALGLAASATTKAGADNVEWRLGTAEDLPADTAADLVMTLDVLHDLPRPDRAAAAIHRALADDGVWLVKEIRSTGEFASDQHNPLLPLFYGFSLFSCLQSALSEPGGMGLGTLGLHPERLRALITEAGFGSIATHDVNEPSNLYYEVRR